MASMLEPGIFRHPRPKKSVLPAPNKRRKIEHKIEEINFNDDSRAEYLTGFHKRKVQRAKQAQLEAAKKAREEKIVMRKQLREERKQELEAHVEAVNSALQAVEDGHGLDWQEKDEDEDGWGGIVEEAVPELVDHEEEYIDEDKYTTVTVEAVDISREGLNKVVDSDAEEEPKKDYSKPEEDIKKKKWPKKERMPKFRYESKVERKAGRAKLKAKKSTQAAARKGND